MNLFKRNQEAEPEPIELPSLREVSGLVPASAKSPEAQRLNLFDPDEEIDEASDQDLAFLHSIVGDDAPRAVSAPARRKKPTRTIEDTREAVSEEQRRADDLQVFREVAAMRQQAELAKQFNIADVDMGDLLEDLATTRAALRRGAALRRVRKAA